MQQNEFLSISIKLGYTWLSRSYGCRCNAHSTAFSNNIFEELSPEDQRREYAATNTSTKHVEYRIFKNDADNPALYEYYL